MSDPIVSFDEAAMRGELRELVRRTVEDTLNALLEEEADDLIGADRYERTAGREAYRAGHYERGLTTTSGQVTLRMPKLKGMRFATAIIERYKRRETSVEEAMIEMYLAGVSTRRIEDVSEILWGASVSASTVSNLSDKAFEAVEEWRSRPLTRKYPYVFVDGIYLKRSWGGSFENVAVMVAIGVMRPLLRLAQASRSIAEGDLSSPDLPVKSSDEVGRLTGTFNQMKHAMAQQLTSQQALHREEVRNLALEKDLEHTRLEVLKSQVNPHFLFNTLNMISCMARLEDASTTDQMIVHLGSLFRHNLRTKRQQITLEEELDGLEDYIYLQQMRFDGRITVEKSIQVQPAAVLVPSFMLQPVVENAYSHGLKSCEEGGRILLRAWMQGKVLVLTVADNGRGMTPEELDAVQAKIAQSEQTGRSIGLGNISRRIGMLPWNCSYGNT